jgi:AraC-like DNA-binding protein
MTDKATPWRAEGSVREYRGKYAAHRHAHAQVLVGLRGTLLLEVDGREAFVDTACALVIPAGCAHGYLARSPAEVLVIDCAGHAELDRVRRFAPPPHWAKASRLPSAEAVLSMLAERPNRQARRALDVDLVTRAIDAAVHRDWTVNELAALCHFSPQRFRARFTELVGLPPSTYVRQRRLDEAQRQLRAGVPLETVALQVGYASASALGFALRRDRGLGARVLRRH